MFLQKYKYNSREAGHFLSKAGVNFIKEQDHFVLFAVLLRKICVDVMSVTIDHKPTKEIHEIKRLN